MRSTRRLLPENHAPVTSFIALVLMLTVACIHKTGGAVTPWERVTTDNAVFAQFNNTVEQGAEAANASGLLDTAKTASLLTLTDKVQAAHQKVTDILAQGPDVTLSNGPAITALINDIKQYGVDLVASGNYGIKNPKSQQTIAADIQALASLGNAILLDIEAVRAARGGK